MPRRSGRARVVAGVRRPAAAVNAATAAARRLRAMADAARGRDPDVVSRLEELVRANLALTRQWHSDAVLQTLVEVARGVVGARYAAIQVVAADGSPERFLHAGIDPDTVAAIGPLPSARGVLGAVLEGGHATRLADLRRHPAAVGFPPHHPPMRSLLAVPLRLGDRLLGVLYLTEKAGGTFTAADQEIVERLAEQAAVAVEHARIHQALTQVAITDPLTGLRNRRELERLLAVVPRQPFAVLAVDVDDLKATNDRHGHDAGDTLLRTVGTALQRLVRGWDVVARVGGDEFAVFLPGADAVEARAVAERMRLAVGAEHAGTRRVTISIGLAAGGVGSDPRAVWSAADAALLHAKRHGRDRVEGPPDVSASAWPC